jgi:phage shock protein PspC (stress-responsive transcriptional regulator)
MWQDAPPPQGGAMNETPTLAEPLAADPGPESGTGSTTWAPPPPPFPPPYPKPRPPLRRSRADRVIAGVCGGIARQYAIDPVLLRILVVVLTIFSGGTFLIAYVLGWIFITDDPAYDPVPMPGSATAPGTVAGTYGGPSYAAGGTGTFVDPATGVVHGASAYAPAPRREPRSYLGLVTVSVAVIVGGILALLGVAGLHIPAVVVASSMLGVIALGLVVGAFRGRARWLIAPAVILLLVTQVAAVVPKSLNASFDGGVGDRRWTPTTSSPAPFELGAGDARLQLSSLPTGPATISTRVGIGQLTVTVPPATRVVLHAHVGAGEIDLPATPAQSGTSLDVQTTIEPLAGREATTTVDLTVDIGLGQLEVRRASS